jgi:hypothetical protein
VRTFREYEPDPEGSPGIQTVKPVSDDPGGFGSNARNALDEGGHASELLEAPDVGILQRLPSAYRQMKTFERITGPLGSMPRHRSNSWLFIRD